MWLRKERKGLGRWDPFQTLRRIIQQSTSQRTIFACTWPWRNWAHPVGCLSHRWNLRRPWLWPAPWFEARFGWFLVRTSQPSRLNLWNFLCLQSHSPVYPLTSTRRPFGPLIKRFRGRNWVEVSLNWNHPLETWVRSNMGSWKVQGQCPRHPKPCQIKTWPRERMKQILRALLGLLQKSPVFCKSMCRRQRRKVSSALLKQPKRRVAVLVSVNVESSLWFAIFTWSGGEYIRHKILLSGTTQRCPLFFVSGLRGGWLCLFQWTLKARCGLQFSHGLEVSI